MEPWGRAFGAPKDQLRATRAERGRRGPRISLRSFRATVCLACASCYASIHEQHSYRERRLGRGRATFDLEGIRIPGGVIGYAIPFGAFLSIGELDRERHSTAVDKIATGAAGGIVGGLAAGAHRCLTGPAGAVIGALAGAVLAVRRTVLTCRVELRDGRAFIAVGRKGDWAAIRDAIRRAPPIVLEVQAAAASPTVRSAGENISTAISHARSGLAWLRGKT